jgi:hypothetical protein
MGIFRSKAFQFSENWKAYYAETSRKLPKVREGNAWDAERKSSNLFFGRKIQESE